MQDVSAAIARQLTEDEQSQRIYKLLLYVTQNLWEAEAIQPTEMAMLGVVRNLLSQFSDFALLDTHLHASVNTLSKPAAYSQVADVILDAIAIHLRTPGEESSTTFFRSPPISAQTAEAYEIDRRITLITDSLLQNPKAARLKKLLLCVDRGTWEGDTNRLEKITWRDILYSLYQQYPQIKLLQQSMDGVVDRLSKPIEYGVIAQIAIQAMQPLYHPLNLQPVEETSSPDLTAQASSDHLLNSPADLLNETDNPTDPASGEHSIADPDLPIWDLAITPVSSIIFDLRHDIIKTGNPLRTKQLLLMLVLGIDAQDALQSSALRHESTLTLLSTAFRLHRKPEILAIKLKEIARKLPQPDEYEGTIDAIIRAFKSRDRDTKDEITDWKKREQDRMIPPRSDTRPVTAPWAVQPQ